MRTCPYNLIESQLVRPTLRAQPRGGLAGVLEVSYATEGLSRGVLHSAAGLPKTDVRKSGSLTHKDLQQDSKAVAISPVGELGSWKYIRYRGVDWTLLVKGMRVRRTRVISSDAFGKALQAGVDSEGPTLIGYR